MTNYKPGDHVASKGEYNSVWIGNVVILCCVLSDSYLCLFVDGSPLGLQTIGRCSYWDKCSIKVP